MELKSNEMCDVRAFLLFVNGCLWSFIVIFDAYHSLVAGKAPHSQQLSRYKYLRLSKKQNKKAAIPTSVINTDV